MKSAIAISALLLLGSALVVSGQDEDPHCFCSFAYHCDDGPDNPNNLIHQIEVSIGGCFAAECEAYCSSLGSSIQDLDTIISVPDEDGEFFDETIGQFACEMVGGTAWNRDVALYSKVCTSDWKYLEIHSNQLLCCSNTIFGIQQEDCSPSAQAEC